jgi:long-chain fatty acid transport protein
MRRTWMACLALAALLLVARDALADGVMLDGVSPRATGRGGTNVGYADNGAMILDNPAAMTNVEGDGLLDVGGDGVLTNLRYSDPTRSGVSTGFTPLPQIGYVRKSADGNWALGIGMFTPAGFSSHYYLTPTAFPPVEPFLGTQKYESFGSLSKILPSLSYKLTDRLSIGGTFGVGVGYASLQGPYVLQNPTGVPAGTPVLIDVHGGGASPVWSAAMQYLLTDDTTIGVTYQSGTTFNLHGTAAVSTNLAGLPFSTTYQTATTHITWPQSVAIGARHKLCPCRTVAMDVIWYDWSQAFSQVGLTLQDSTNPLFPTIHESLPLNWHDSVSMKLGYEEILPIGGTFRIGYVYHPNPIPTSFLTPFLPATLTNTFTIGYGFNMGQWLCDVAWAHGFSGGHTVGTSGLIGPLGGPGDFSNATMRPQADVIAVSLIRPF